MVVGRARPEHSVLRARCGRRRCPSSRPAPPRVAARSSSNTAWGLSKEKNLRSCRALAQGRTEHRCPFVPAPGGSSARRRRMTRPSRLVTVPSSSAHCAEGSTTSATFAVSERKKSATARKSSRPRRPLTFVAFGAETIGLDPTTRSARMPPGSPADSISSYADLPGPGISPSGIPHTAATSRRAAGSSMRR